MPRKLRWKWLAIVAVVALCVTGVTGLPASFAELARNWRENIRLGLDLKGGSHIVLQIQVQDAFKAEADRVIEQVKDLLSKNNIQYSSIDRNDPGSADTAATIQVSIKGVPAA
ncbi:MAG: protein translocase subunit SecD, partial [Bryobacteraceae bacterium]|nr:protein translocase subunit SecD [Bryobacteraceae bacterium]